MREKVSESLKLTNDRNNHKTDFLVVGAGVVGMSIALELKKRNSSLSVLVIEKEDEVALHASGRNSGVLHAGFYYSPDSLKARLTVQGNERLREYCLTNELPIRECGKVVVAQDELQTLEIENLFQRGVSNGVALEIIDSAQLAKVEPLAKTSTIALWSPRTAVADPYLVAQQLRRDLDKSGVKLLVGHRVMKIDGGVVLTEQGHTIEFDHFVNSAGLYADKIAKLFGHGQRYRMLPFLGLYLYAPRLRGTLSSHIYPTPDPRNPFLGAHLTRTSSDDVKLGPTAIPILAREQYKLFQNIKLPEIFESASIIPRFLFSKKHDTFSLIRTELPKISAHYLRSQVAPLVQGINLDEFSVKGKPGIRAQLFDLKTNGLEMDFVVEGDSTSTHVLNAVSPGWTTCFSFANFVVDEISKKVRL